MKQTYDIRGLENTTTPDGDTSIPDAVSLFLDHYVTPLINEPPVKVNITVKDYISSQNVKKVLILPEETLRYTGPPDVETAETIYPILSHPGTSRDEQQFIYTSKEGHHVVLALMKEPKGNGTL